MPLALQAKLLRVLERKVITRVGGTTEVATDARLIAATHRDLEAEVRAGRFRQDLFFRIGGFTLVVPPLRDRADRDRAARRALRARRPPPSKAGPRPTLTDDARDALAGYALARQRARAASNAIERALVLCGDAISRADLPEKLRDAAPARAPGRRRPPTCAATSPRSSAPRSSPRSRPRIRTRRAPRAGSALSRRALIYKMEKYGLKPPPGKTGL